MAGALLAVLDVPRFDCTPGWRAVDHTYSGCLETKGLAVSTQDSMAARGRASAPAYEQQSPGSATQQSQADPLGRMARNHEAGCRAARLGRRARLTGGLCTYPTPTLTLS